MEEIDSNQIFEDIAHDLFNPYLEYEFNINKALLKVLLNKLPSYYFTLDNMSKVLKTRLTSSNKDRMKLKVLNKNMIFLHHYVKNLKKEKIWLDKLNF